MTNQELINEFYHNHKELSDFIGALDDEKFLYSVNGKWSAGQQLEHVLLCLMPISQALNSKDFIREKFGTINRPVLSYSQVISNYKTGLEQGGKAPERFLPQPVTLNDRSALTTKMLAILDTITQYLEHYSESELDTFVLPHPFLGKLSIRELLFLMTYHATHHLKQTEDNLTRQ